MSPVAQDFFISFCDKNILYDDPVPDDFDFYFELFRSAVELSSLIRESNMTCLMGSDGFI